MKNKSFLVFFNIQSKEIDQFQKSIRARCASAAFNILVLAQRNGNGIGHIRLCPVSRLAGTKHTWEN